MASVVQKNEGNWLEKAVSTLNKGKVVAFPTETSYGLAARIDCFEAIERIREIKGLSQEKPISVIVDSLTTIEKYAELNEDARKLVKAFMPGPLTLVVEKKDFVPDILSKDSIAFRISSYPVAFQLSKKIGVPLTATSANLTGEGDIYSAKKLIEKLGEKIDLIIDAGELERKKPSTIFDVRTKKVLREGEIKKEEIRKILSELK